LKVSRLPHLKRNAVVTIPYAARARLRTAAACSRMLSEVVTARIDRFIADDSTGRYPDME
jgi:hypothetical protein